MEIFKLISLGFQSFSGGITSFVVDPDFIINPLTILVVLIIAMQYKNMMSIQKQMYGGRVRTRLRDFVSSSLLAGILAGLVGSILITTLGITFLSPYGLSTIIIFSLLLMFFVNPRYVCISYSGGILSIIALIFVWMISIGWLDPKNQIVGMVQTRLDFDVSALMIVVAMMHLIEAALMWIDGHRGAVPVFMKHKGQLVGGFVMQRLWLLPIIFIILVQSKELIGETVATPAWWPLFGPNMSRKELSNAVFGSMPLLAMLGYSDFSITTPVKEKVRRSALELLGFGAILLVLALISYKVYAFKFIAALFAPLAHEFVILYERYKETVGEPLWGQNNDGVMVVDTIPKSPAEKIGIRSGDKVIGINNNPIKSVQDLLDIMSTYINYMWIEVVNLKGESRTLEYVNYQTGIDELGIITVPDSEMSVVVMEEHKGNLVKDLIQRIKRK